MYTKEDVFLVGPGGAQETVKLGGSSKGLVILKEIDGLRIVNSDYVFFLEKIQNHVINTFDEEKRNEDYYDEEEEEDEQCGKPSTILLQAIRSLDFGVPKADGLLKHVIEKNGLVNGIETLLDMAKLEHWDIQIMKHFLRTAAYAKKYD